MKKDNYETIVEYIVKNQSKFYRLAFTYVKHQEDALDVVQNAVCRALEHYESLQAITAVNTWFYRILVNESINYLKQHGREIPAEESDLDTAASYEDSYEEDDDLYDAINRLPYEIQHIIKLKFYEDMSLKEIAEITMMNLNTVKSKLYKGLKHLKQELQEVSA